VCGLSADAFTPSQSRAQPALATNRRASPVTMMMPGGHPQQPAPIVVTQVPAAGVRPQYLHCQSIAVGVVLIIIGVLSAIFNIVGIVMTVDMLESFGYSQSVSYVSHGIWTGILVRTADTWCLTASQNCPKSFTSFKQDVRSLCAPKL